MPSCSYCGTTILFGGVRDYGFRYCNTKCRDKDSVRMVASRFPDEAVADYVQEVHQGECPKCGGSGPVDVHTSYTIWSFAVFTSWQSHPEVCCRLCGIKAKINGALFCGALGWWGFPWGFIGTPIQILRNLGGILFSPHSTMPSRQLENMVRVDLATRFLEERRQQQSAAEVDHSSNASYMAR